MVKHLLFDADGVLFFHTDKMFSERLVEDYGSSEDSLKSFFSGVWPECLIGKKDTRAELSARLLEWHWPGSVDDLMQYWYTYEHNIDEPLIDYVRSLGQRGIKASVATNNDHYRAVSLFDRLNLDEAVFDRLYAAGDLGVAKPDHEFFRKVLEDIPHIAADEILFWDDSVENIEAARSFGILAEHYTDFSKFAERMKQYV